MRTHGVVALFAVLAACGGGDPSGDPAASSSGGSSGGASSGGGSSGGGSSSGGSSSGGVVPDPSALIPTGSVWHQKSEWYRDIREAPVAEMSSEMIAALPRWGTADIFQIDFSFVVLDGAGAPQVTFPAYDEGDNVPVPMPDGGYVEGEYDYASCPEGDDCHVLVVDAPALRLYEVYQVRRDGAEWLGQPTLWQLDKVYPRQNRGQGCTSADAAGMAITPGLIGYRETKAGRIAHALRLVLRNEFIRGRAGDRDVPNVVYPASHGSLAGAAATGIPYGGRLRLKASVSRDDARFRSAGAKAVIDALHTYGMILSDGGNIPLMAESARVHHDADTSATWDGLLGPRDLQGLEPSDFEVIGIPKDVPGGAPGFFATRSEYEAELKKPLGCAGIVQP